MLFYFHNLVYPRHLMARRPYSPLISFWVRENFFSSGVTGGKGELVISYLKSFTLHPPSTSLKCQTSF